MTAAVPLVDRLIEAWSAWVRQSRAEAINNRKLDLIDELGLNSSDMHRAVAAAMQAGQDVPSAVQTAINSIAPHLSVPELKEAS